MSGLSKGWHVWASLENERGYRPVLTLSADIATVGYSLC